MKKIILSILLLLIPFQVLAYSKQVIIGGNTIGIDVKTEGVMIVGFYKIGGKYNSGALKSGDYITKINDTKINTISELTNLIEKNVNSGQINITYIRNKKEYETKLNLIYEDNVYKTGLYVKDSITGIGTLTYVDPETKIFGALGHEITESNSSNIVDIKTGSIFKNSITSIDKSISGVPGSKNAKFYHEIEYGTIEKNSVYGIYGKYNKELDNNLVEVADKEELKLGAAKILTVIKGEDVDEFAIQIKSINEYSSVKNFTFEITDEKLIDGTGGIVQGMSGSPIMQNGKIIGAVTHVIVDNPITGYGVFITNMLEEGEK